MTEWLLALFLAGSEVPGITAGPYETEEQCFMAGDLMKAADKAVRGKDQAYTISCNEREKSALRARP